MKPSISLAATLFLAAFLTPASAHADGYGASGSGAGYSGFGILTATDQGSGQYLITGMSGLGSPTLFAPGGFQDNDNLLFPNADQYVDASGFAFTISTGEDTDNVDISSTGSGYQAYIVDEGGNQETVPVTFDLTPESDGDSPDAAPMFFAMNAGTQNGVETFAFDFSADPPAAPAATPEPSSFALLATGLAGLITAARRRRA